MLIYFEELSAPKRAGGIEAATCMLASKLEEIGISVIRSSERSHSDRNVRPDCVHIHGIWSPKLAWRLRKWHRLGTPCVVSPHGMLDPWALAHKATRKKIAWPLYQKRLLNLAVAVHATSQRESDQFQSLGITAPAVVIPWGIENSAHAVAPRAVLPKATCNARTALFVGRICPVKGLPLLVEAWRRVMPSNWRLQIAGPDEAGYRGHVESLVTAAGIGGVVDFLGSLSASDRDVVLSNAELFILPSYTENFGLVVGEALASGTPVITTTGTPWECVVDAACGWYVPATIEGIESALRHALSLSSDELHRMGARGKELISAQFSWDHVVEEFAQLYQSSKSGFQR